MAKRIGDDFLLERITRLEDHQIEHSDALDVKLSYVLVAIVFLLQLAFAIFTANIKESNVQVCLLLVATACTLVSGGLSFRGLMLVKCNREDPQSLEKARDEYVTECAKGGYSEDQIRQGLIEGFIDATRQRISENAETVNDKVYWLRSAYSVCALAVLLYVTDAVVMLISSSH